MLNLNDIMTVSDSFIHLEEFVDRVTETNQFQELVEKRYDERDMHKRVIAFYGPAGIGKTMLLDRLEFECIRKKIPYSRINFEIGIYNNTIEILRELVREIDYRAFEDWIKLDRYWFSSELEIPSLNVNLQGQAGGVNVNAETVNVSGDVVAGSKVEIKNNTINMATRAALDPLGAQTALTESFVKILGDFVQEHPAVILFEGVDHEYCSPRTRVWVQDLLDRIRVLKGYGVLPIVTYFNSPTFESKLRSVTYRAELKPLSQEHIIEYFRARRIPGNIMNDASLRCVEETRGIPARVYEFAENIISTLGEEGLETRIQPGKTAEQEVEKQAEPLETAQPFEEALPALDAVQPVQEEIVSNIVAEQPVQEMVIPGVVEEQLVQPEQEKEPVSVVAVEEGSLPKTTVSESLTAIEEMPEVVQPEETISEESAPAAEAVLPVQEEAVVDERVERDAVQEAIQQPVEEVEEPKAEAPVMEAAQVPDVSVEKEEQTEVKTVEQIETTLLTVEEEKRAEEAYLRSQEKLRRLKEQGKNSTEQMVDSLLERQSAEVADVAQRCAVLRWFNADLIEAIADEPMNSQQISSIIETISSWPFVQSFGYGSYAYRREVQQYLREQVRNDNPELYEKIHQRAYAYFDKKLGLSDSIDETIWVTLQSDQLIALREKLYYLLHVDVMRGFDLLGKLFQSAQRMYLHGEAAILLKFADEIDKSILSEHYKNQLAYYEAALNFAEGEAGSAEAKLRELMVKPLENELNAQVLGQMGVILAGSGKYDDAIKTFEQAQKVWQNLKRERERAKLSNNLGNVYMRKNDPGRAERAFNDALNGLNKVGTPSERALTLNNLGNVYMQKENMSKALEHYQKSLEIKKSIGDQFGAANTFSNLGTVYQRMAQEASGKKQAEYRQQAADFYSRSLETYRTFGARSNQGKLLFKLAFFHYQAGDKAKAKEYLPDALEIFRDLEMPDLENASKLEKQLG